MSARRREAGPHKADRHRDDLLADLRDLADEVAAYVSAWTEAEYLKDRAKQRALERALELLGEAATQLGDEAPDVGVDWRSLRDLRVLLARLYHRVDPRRLWVHATVGVPRLGKALEGYE